MSNIKEIIRDRLRNYAFAITILVIIAAASILLLALPLPNCPEWVKFLANSTLGAVIGAALVDIVCSIADGKEAEDDMRKGIMETLCPSKTGEGKPELYSLYKKEAIEPILHQCLSAYCADGNISAGYLSYIKNSCLDVKRNEKYLVDVLRDDSGCQKLSQYLKHTSIFKPNVVERPYCQAYFIFKTRSEHADQKGKLDKVMNDKSYFFREELADDSFVDELIRDYDAAVPSGKAAINKAVLSKLGFSFNIFHDEYVKSSIRVNELDFDIELDKDCGVKIMTYVPQECIHTSDQFYEEEGFVQFTASMKTEYRIPSTQNTFYVVYAIPTIKSYFEIKFKMGSHDFTNKVDYMTFMSIDQSVNHYDVNDGVVQNHGSSLSFTCSRTIFPRSGMSFTWNS